MKYIVVRQPELSVEVVEEVPTEGFIVPATLNHALRDLSPLEEAIYYKVLYAAVWEEDRIKYAEERKQGTIRSYKLFEPDPWLVAIGYIMWEGIVQGLSWDLMKLSIQQAMEKMRQFQVAPPGSSSQKQVASEVRLGFHWVEYADGEKQREMFLGLSRAYKEMSEIQRSRVSNSEIKAVPTTRRKRD